MDKQIELTPYDKECLARLGRQAQSIQRITRFIESYRDYDRCLTDLNAAKRRFEEAENAMDDYDKEVYRKLCAKVQNDESKGG